MKRKEVFGLEEEPLSPSEKLFVLRRMIARRGDPRQDTNNHLLVEEYLPAEEVVGGRRTLPAPVE